MSERNETRPGDGYDDPRTAVDRLAGMQKPYDDHDSFPVPVVIRITHDAMRGEPGHVIEAMIDMADGFDILEKIEERIRQLLSEGKAELNPAVFDHIIEVN